MSQLRSGPRGSYTRGYLPHRDHHGVVQSITFRLADARPRGLLASTASPELDHELTRDLGARVLGQPQAAEIVATALRFFDGKRYVLGPWVIMPDHVHALLRVLVGFALGDIVHSWKSFTAKRINALTGGSGRVWQREYYDRVVRDERQLVGETQYIHDNPVRDGLVSCARDWPFSSARDPAPLERLLGRATPARDAGRHARGAG